MRPTIICHMISSVDGRLITDYYSEPFDGKDKDEVMNPYFTLSDNYNADAWIVGRKTVQRHYFPNSYTHTSDKAANPQTFIANREAGRAMLVIDPQGKIKYEDNKADGDDIITILSEQVSEDYLTFLREKGISYLFAGADGKDIAGAMETLGTEFGMTKILLEGGGIINGTFLKAALIDELSLMIYPGIDGLHSRPSIFDYLGNDDENPSEGQSLELLSNQTLEDGIILLHYKFHRK